LCPQGEKRKALIFRPSFWKAELEGAKMVPPWWACGPVRTVVVSLVARPEVRMPRAKVLNCVGTISRSVQACGGGRRTESMP
jgi:hypothetical protein